MELVMATLPLQGIWNPVVTASKHLSIGKDEHFREHLRMTAGSNTA